MSAEQNKSIVRRWIEEGWNKHNLAVIDEVYAPNFVQHEPEPQTVNQPGSAQTIRERVPHSLPRLATFHRRFDRRRRQSSLALQLNRTPNRSLYGNASHRPYQ